MATNNGGPAFPTPDCTNWDGPSRTPGMSLRDWFAGMALQGLIASNDEDAGDRIEDLPDYAYNIADAMLVRRAIPPRHENPGAPDAQ